MNLELIGDPICIIKRGEDDKKKKKGSQIISVSDKDVIRPFNELSLGEDDGVFQLIPNPEKERQILYITGASGSGKSYFTRQYCNEFKKLFPKREIFLFSSIADDSSIDEIKGLKRIKLTPELIDEDLSAEDFKDSLVIFDDTDCITDKKMKMKINGVLNSILETGRHFNIYCIYTSHLACAGNDTKRILNEAHSITFFPHSLGGRSLKYLLDSYLGLDKQQIQKVKGLKSRWVCAVKSYPQVILAEKDIYLISN
jgi:predicted AAA+ superfamily ATPase